MEPADRPPVTTRKAWIDAGVVGAICFFIYIIITPYLPMQSGGTFIWRGISGNEQSNFALARAIVEKGSFKLDSIGFTKGDNARYKGHVYSNKPPGFALILAAPYALFYYLLAPALGIDTFPNFMFIVPILMGATLVSVIYLTALELGLSRRAASFAALTSGLGTIVIVYSTTLTNNIATALFGALAIWTAIKFKHTSKMFYAPLSAFLAAYAVVVNYAAIVLVLPACLYLLVAAIRARGAGAVKLTIFMTLGAVAIPAAFLGFYHYQCFDSLFSTGYSHYNPPKQINWKTPYEAYTGGSVLNGLAGLTISRGKGVFYYTPVLLFALPGMLLAFRSRSRRWEAVMIAITIAGYILLFSPYRYWFGGHSLGARHALPVIPLLALFTACYYDRASATMKKLMVILVAPSALVHLLLALSSHSFLILELTWVGERNPAVQSRITNLYSELLPIIITNFPRLPNPLGSFMGPGWFTAIKVACAAGIAGGVYVAYRRIYKNSE